MTGFRTLLYKELLRFWKVSFQTIAAPVLTSVLYMMIFGHVLEADFNNSEVLASANTRPCLSMARRPHKASASSK